MGREVQRGCSPPHTEHPAFTGPGCNFSAWPLPEVFKSSYHEQRMEFACKLGKAGINKPNGERREQACMAAACYSNILLPVSAPTESSWFLSCLLFCKHYRGYCLPEKHSHFSLPWPFVSCPGLPPALSWHLRGSCVKAANQLLASEITLLREKKLFFNLGQQAESPHVVTKVLVPT